MCAHVCVYVYVIDFKFPNQTKSGLLTLSKACTTKLMIITGSRNWHDQKFPFIVKEGYWEPGHHLTYCLLAYSVHFNHCAVLVVKNLPGNAGSARDSDLIHGLERFPWSRKWQPTPVYLAWKFSWTEEPGRLQSTGPQVKCEVKAVQSCQTLCNPMDFSLPVSSIHGIL